MQLSRQQLYIKAGEISIVDASVIQAKQNRQNKGIDGNNTQDQKRGIAWRQVQTASKKPRMDSMHILQ